MPHYDGHCRDLSPEEVAAKLAAGEPYVIRQKIPAEGVTAFDDVVYGHIEVNNAELDDQILIKSDGMPTYNFANVVDDHLMGITHVIRGSEYLSSTPKYNLLYEAFGWDLPTYIHCPPVMKDAQHKLSKRNGDASYQDLVAKGYLPAAVLNYLLLLGWAPEGEQEIFTLDEMVNIWDPARISKSPAIFDPLKLRAINAAYIRALPAEEFRRLADPFIDSAVHRPIDRDLLCANLQPRCEVLEDIPRSSISLTRRCRSTPSSTATKSRRRRPKAPRRRWKRCWACSRPRPTGAATPSLKPAKRRPKRWRKRTAGFCTRWASHCPARPARPAAAPTWPPCWAKTRRSPA